MSRWCCPHRNDPCAGARVTLAIIHADDLGLSDAVNRGIMCAHREGVVTSASFLANFPASEAGARAALEQAPALEMGLHLNLTEGRALTGASSLTNGDGHFHPLGRQLLALAVGVLHEDDVYAEAAAQLARARALGLRISHLDGHEHVHLFGAARRAAFALAQRESLALRRPREAVLATVGGSPTYAARRMLLRWGAAGAAWRAVRHAGALIDLTGPRRGRSAAWLVDRLRERGGTVEVLCHPGEADGPAGDPLRERRPFELGLLTTPGLREALGAAGVTLTTFARALSDRPHDTGSVTSLDETRNDLRAELPARLDVPLLDH